MTEPWSGLPAVLADEVSGVWRHVFPEGVPAWAGEAVGMGPEALAGAIDDALALPKRRFTVQTGGAERSAEILMDDLEQRSR